MRSITKSNMHRKQIPLITAAILISIEPITPILISIEPTELHY